MPRFKNALARLWPARVPTLAEEKASRTGPLIAFETLGRPVWTPRDYATFAREGFMQNPIVYRAVRMVAEAASSIPLLLYEGADEHDEHPLLDLLAQPSKDQTGTDFFEAWYGYLLVSGNAYAEAVAIGGRVRELHALRPDRMKVVPGLEGWPEAYDYTAGGRTVRFDTEAVPGVRPILHVRMFHPTNDHYGMSPIEAAATAIDIHNTASRWNKALLDNSARPSGALVYSADDARMTAEQFERLKSELETSFQGAKHAGRPLLLEGGLDWKPLSLSPKDMDFIEAKNSAAREIALALGVPPMLLGIPGDNTYSNYQEAQRAFWRQTVLPLVNRTAKALSAWLGAEHGASLQLKPDIDQIEALSSEREALWARLNAVSYLTVNEKRAAVGYGPIDAEGEEGTAGPFDEAAPSRGGVDRDLKYRPDQPRVPAGSSDGGQWTDEGGGFGGDDGRIISDATPDDIFPPGSRVAQGRTGSYQVRYPGVQAAMTPGQAARYAVANQAARESIRRVNARDPNWRPTPSLYETAEGAIRAREAEGRQAEARLRELLRDAIPNTNPDWAINRLRKELNTAGYRFKEVTRSPGFIYESGLGAQVRIMRRPSRVYRSDPSQKHQSDYYYRYRRSDDQGWGDPISIPNLD